ncbi:MAG: hypothetical protein AAB451_02150 [Patescibacteria group bacterium]
MKKITSWIKRIFQGKKETKVAEEPRPTGGLWTEGFGAVGATLKTLQDLGVTPEHLKRIRSEPSFAAHVARQILLMPQGAPIDMPTVWNVMGYENVFDYGKWDSLFRSIGYDRKVMFTEKEKTLPIIRNVPISEKDLWAVRHTHFLFLGISHCPDGMPLTISTWQKVLLPKMKGAGIEAFFMKDGSNFSPAEKYLMGQPFFAEQTLRLGWHLVRKDILPLSRSLRYKEQCKLCPTQEKIATPLELVTALILSLYKKNAGPQFQLRTAQEIDEGRGGQLVMGLSGEKIVLSADCEYWNHEWREVDSNIGLATAWKFPEI